MLGRSSGAVARRGGGSCKMLCLYVCVCGAGAVGVAGDELLALLAFVVHRVARCAGQRREEENETTAKNEDAARKIEPFAARDLWEQSIMLGTVVCFAVVRGPRGDRARRVRSSTSSRTCYHQRKDEDEPHNHAVRHAAKRRPGLTGIPLFCSDLSWVR